MTNNINKPNTTTKSTIKQPAVNEMIMIMHQRTILDHYDLHGGEMCLGLTFNDSQYYKDMPIIALQYAGGEVQCWAPDADVSTWVFTYCDNSGCGESDSWEYYIPVAARVLLTELADHYNLPIYNYDNPEGVSCIGRPMFSLNYTV